MYKGHCVPKQIRRAEGEDLSPNIPLTKQATNYKSPLEAPWSRSHSTAPWNLPYTACHPPALYTLLRSKDDCDQVLGTDSTWPQVLLLKKILLLVKTARANRHGYAHTKIKQVTCTAATTTPQKQWLKQTGIIIPFTEVINLCWRLGNQWVKPMVLRGLKLRC